MPWAVFLRKQKIFWLQVPLFPATLEFRIQQEFGVNVMLFWKRKCRMEKLNFLKRIIHLFYSEYGAAFMNTLGILLVCFSDWDDFYNALCSDSEFMVKVSLTIQFRRSRYYFVSADPWEINLSEITFLLSWKTTLAFKIFV